MVSSEAVRRGVIIEMGGSQRGQAKVAGVHHGKKTTRIQAIENIDMRESDGIVGRRDFK